MIITSLGNSEPLAQKIAKKLRAKYVPTTIAAFPDGELYLKFNTDLKGKKLVIIQSFQPHPDMSLFDIVFAAETAKDLGAKKFILLLLISAICARIKDSIPENVSPAESWLSFLISQ